jgi:hypothetical protein
MDASSFKGGGRKPPAPLTFVPSLPPVGVHAAPAPVYTRAVRPVAVAVTAPLPSIPSGDIKEKILKYVQITEDKAHTGNNMLMYAIPRLMFSDRRDSNTAMLEAGYKIPLYKGVVSRFIKYILTDANEYYGQTFAFEPLYCEPAAYSE